MFNWFKNKKNEPTKKYASSQPLVEKELTESVKRVKELMAIKEQKIKQEKEDKKRAEALACEKRLAEFAPLYKFLQECYDHFPKFRAYRLDGTESYIIIGGTYAGSPERKISILGEEFAPKRFEISKRNETGYSCISRYTFEELMNKLPDIVVEILS